ncbi:MAG: hydrogenase iron-sulfur subunit [Thermodesulfobacteriota bacterium]
MKFAQLVEIIFLYSFETDVGWFDFPELALWTAGLSQTRVLALDPALPELEQEERLRAFLLKGKRHPVVLVGLDPLWRGRATINLLLEKFRLNPGLLALVDLYEALQYPHAKYVLIKAQELIYLAATRVAQAHPTEFQDFPMNSRVLVWGDSWAACQAALELAQQDHEVILAAPGSALPETPPPDLMPLLNQVQAQALIQPLWEASIMDLAGGAGNFTVQIKTGAGLREERVGAVILAPEFRLTANFAGYGLSPQPRLLSQTQLESLLLSEPETDHPPLGVAAFLLGLAGDTCPQSLRRALGAASRLLSRNRQVHLFLGQAQVAAPGLEEALENALAAGLFLYKLQETPEIVPEKDGIKLGFRDPILLRPLEIRADVVVVEENYYGAPENQFLSLLTQIGPAPSRFLQGENVHHLAGVTNRRGIFVVGPGHGVLELPESLTEAKATALEVSKLLDRGHRRGPKAEATVDRGRCVLCLTCYRLCPHGAITWDNRALIRDLDCQGCGLCASECPNNAIHFSSYSDEQMFAELENLDPRLHPRIIAFMCRNSAWIAYQAALKLEQGVLPLGFTAFKLPCAGKIDLDFILKAFTMGAAGVLVLACHPENCRSHRGNLHAHWRTEQAQALLVEAGLHPGRVLFQTLAANSPSDLLKEIDQWCTQLREIEEAVTKKVPA